MLRTMPGRVGAQRVSVAGSISVEDCGKLAWQSIRHSFARAPLNQETDHKLNLTVRYKREPAFYS